MTHRFTSISFPLNTAPSDAQTRLLASNRKLQNMSSIRRLISSRMNAAHSTGPKTPQGKLRSSQNALRHGCRSRKPMLDSALPLPTDYTPILEDHLAALRPTTPKERILVEKMAIARARQILVQIREIEMWNKVAHHKLEDAWDALCDIPGFVSLDRYEGACHRAYHRALQDFLALRSAKRKRTIKATLVFPDAVDNPSTSLPGDAEQKNRTNEATLSFQNVARTPPHPHREPACRHPAQRHGPHAGHRAPGDCGAAAKRLRSSQPGKPPPSPY